MAGRLPDWETRFVAYLGAARAAVREGRDDYCALFASGAVEAVTGTNPADAFRGRYREVADNLEAVVSGLFAEIAPGVAQRGDIAWHDGSVGVVIGGEALFIGDHNDFERVPRHLWERAWTVG
jgi:hypothetical protein